MRPCETVVLHSSGRTEHSSSSPYNLADAAAAEGTILSSTSLDAESRSLVRQSILRSWPVLVTIVLLAALCWSRRWSAEDSFINYRVIDQLLHGRGPVYNQGERVEVFTSPLWLGLVALLKAVLPFVPVEWIAVIVGLTFTMAGVVLASLASSRLLSLSPTGPLFPVGILALVGLSPFWDFATSGLETGMSFAWLGGSVWLLAQYASSSAPTKVSMVAAPLALGLGPLIRPDFALILLPLLGANLVLTGMRPWWVVRVVGVALLPAVLYQIFRMAYYSSLVPNTALAKEAGGANWSQGWAYVVDLYGTHYLWVAVGLCVAVAAPSLVTGRGNNRQRVVCGACVAGAALHAAYVIRIGGDYMHGRFLLPSLFLLLCPFMVAKLPLDNRRYLVGVGAMAVGLGAWALIGAMWLRPSYEGKYDIERGLTDERGFWSFLADHPHPVTLDDYRRTPNWQWGTTLAEMESSSEGGLYYIKPGTFSMELLRELPPGSKTILAGGELGITGTASGRDVPILDIRGLGNPVASRLELTERSGTVGHEKLISYEWAIALASPPSEEDSELVAKAREALSCGDLSELQRHVTKELSAPGLLNSLWHSTSLTFIRVPPDPADAVHRFCD